MLTAVRDCVIVMTLLLLVCGSAMGDPAEVEREKARARAQLIREARRIVRPDAPVAKDTTAAKAALAEDIKLRASWEPATDEDRRLVESWDATIAARRLLLGDPAGVDAEGLPVPPGDGALQQARQLLRWMLGDFPEHQGCGALVNNPQALNEANRERDFSFPELPLADAGTADRDASKTASQPPAVAPPAKGAGTEAPAAPPLPAPQASGKPTLEAWARAVAAAVGGTLRDTQIEPAVCDDVGRLIEAQQTPTIIREPTVPGLKLQRCALETEEPFAYNAAVVALRRLQAGERVETMRSETPSEELVDEGTVRERVLRAEDYAARLRSLEQQREALLEHLDQMVTALDDWKTMAAILGVRIDDRRRELDGTGPPPADGAPPRAPDRTLRVLAAQETTVALEMRLLYMAAVRSEARLGLLRDAGGPGGLLEQLIEAQRDELAAAQASRALYEEELDRVRRERRLDRLEGEARRIRGRLDATKADGGAAGAEATARITAFRALLDLNAIVQDAVRARRELGDWALQPPADGARKSRAEDPLAFARNPATAAWDAATLGRWREMLEHPEFDAVLVAEHYAVGARRLARLRANLDAAVDTVALQDRFRTASSAAERALAPLAERRDLAYRTYNLGTLIETWSRDFDDSLTGMQKERERIKGRRADIVAYQRALLGLGSRSFGIRVVRDLDGDDLAAATQETLDGLASAGRWALLDDPQDNAWQFIKSHWLGILVVIAAIVAVILGTPRARRALDRRLAKRAARYPQIDWTGASVAREREEAQARKRAEEAAAAARTAELLRRAEAEESGEKSPDAPSPDAPSPDRAAGPKDKKALQEGAPDARAEADPAPKGPVAS